MHNVFIIIKPTHINWHKETPILRQTPWVEGRSEPRHISCRQRYITFLTLFITNPNACIVPLDNKYIKCNATQHIRRPRLLSDHVLLLNCAITIYAPLAGLGRTTRSTINKIHVNKINYDHLKLHMHQLHVYLTCYDPLEEGYPKFPCWNKS